jgi:hypothetical protein
MNLIKFIKCTNLQFTNLATKNEDTLYFITDTNQIYKGSTPYTKSVIPYTGELPTTGIIDKLYVNLSLSKISMWNNDTSQWVDLSSSYTHPATHSLDMITETTNKKIMTADERTKLNGIQAGATNYTHPLTHPYSMITGVPTSLPANGGNADTVDGKHASEFVLTTASCNKNWSWTGKSGQPTWLWGGNDAANAYIYNPSNFNVNYANTANIAYSIAIQNGNFIAGDGAMNMADDTIAADNICIGSGALGNMTNGYENTALGLEALFNSSAVRNHSTGLGSHSDVTGNNQIQLGQAGYDSVYGASAYNSRSDARDKADIVELQYDGYNFIKSLIPRQFRWDYRTFYREILFISVDEYNLLPEEEKSKCYILKLNAEEYNKIKEQDKPIYTLLDNAYIAYKYQKQNEKDGSKKRNRYHNGFIAQEVKALADSMGFDFAAFQDHSVNGGDDVYTLAYEEFIAPIVKTIQVLMDKVELLENDKSNKDNIINDLQERIISIENKLNIS